MELNALFLNCTLKKSPEESNTEALIEMVRGHFPPDGNTVEGWEHLPHPG